MTVSAEDEHATSTPGRPRAAPCGLDVLTHEPGGAGNPRAVQIRIRSVNAVRAGGQHRHDLRQGAQPGYVAVERSPLNRVLVEPWNGTRLRKACEARRALRPMQRAMRSSASVAVSGIVTFGHQAQPLFERLSCEAQDAAYRELAEGVAERLSTDLTGLVVHCDTSAPHAHFQLVGYCRDGIPVSTITKRGTLRDLQTLAAEVMGRHAPGIERGFSKLDRLAGGANPADVVHRPVAELHARLPREIAALVARIKALRDQLATLEETARAEEERADAARRKADALEDTIRRRLGSECQAPWLGEAASQD